MNKFQNFKNNRICEFNSCKNKLGFGGSPTSIIPTLIVLLD